MKDLSWSCSDVCVGQGSSLRAVQTGPPVSEMSQLSLETQQGPAGMGQEADLTGRGHSSHQAEGWLLTESETMALYAQFT